MQDVKGKQVGVPICKDVADRASRLGSLKGLDILARVTKLQEYTCIFLAQYKCFCDW